MINHNIDAFYALLRTGLWEQAEAIVNLDLNLNDTIDWRKVYKLAEEQSVVGVVLAGLEQSTVKPPQELLLQWIGEVQMLEQQNMAMNKFVGELVKNMRANDIYTLLVKGQGVAQCYEKPLWRSSGDIDFYLSDTNFVHAKAFLRPLVDSFDPDTEYAQHINMHYGEWIVEIHANQHCSLSARINRVMDEIHRDLFYGGNVRSWNDNGTQVFIPSPDNNVLIIFVHFLNHFYKGGIGLRQICDWCRLLYTNKDSLNYEMLESRICRAGLMSVWRGFAAFAVEYLGMPVEAMPFYSSEKKWKRKADRICSFILEVGNFGHNRDSSYYNNDSKLLRKSLSFKRRCGDFLRHTKIFPLETLRFFPNMIYNGVIAISRGE